MNAKDIYIDFIIGVLWIALYSINHWIFKFTEISSITSLIFVPSGYKIGVASVFRMRGFLGLFLGSLATGFIFLKSFNIVDIAVFSVLSATLPFMALKIMEYLIPLKRDLSNLSIKHILLVGMIYAGLNGVFHIGYEHHDLFLRDAHELNELFCMMTGDILGILLFMLLVSRFTQSSYLKKILT